MILPWRYLDLFSVQIFKERVRCLFYFINYIEGLPLEMDLSDGIVVLSALSLFVEERRVLITCLKPSTTRFNSLVFFLSSHGFVKLLLQIDLSIQ